MSRTPVPAFASPPMVSLAPRNISALVVEELQATTPSLAPSSELREWWLQYPHGQLVDLPRESVEPIVLALLRGDVREIKQFIGDVRAGG